MAVEIRVASAFHSLRRSDWERRTATMSMPPRRGICKVLTGAAWIFGASAGRRDKTGWATTKAADTDGPPRNRKPMGNPYQVKSSGPIGRRGELQGAAEEEDKNRTGPTEVGAQRAGKTKEENRVILSIARVLRLSKLCRDGRPHCPCRPHWQVGGS